MQAAAKTAPDSWVPWGKKNRRRESNKRRINEQINKSEARSSSLKKV